MNIRLENKDCMEIMKEYPDYLYNEQPAMFGHRDVIGFGKSCFYIKTLSKVISNKMIIENHYSKKVAGFATTYIYLGIWIDCKLIGTLQYGFAMNPASARNIVKNTGIYEHLELNRMWLSDGAPKNSESRAISYSIKFIKKKYPKIQWIQSFADERCGKLGVVYQASNFKYYGKHKSDFYVLDGKYIHKIALTHHADKRILYERIRARKDEISKEQYNQYRYIYFINKNKIKDCLLSEQPYPKYNSKQTNRNSKKSGENVLTNKNLLKT